MDIDTGKQGEIWETTLFNSIFAATHGLGFFPLSNPVAQGPISVAVDGTPAIGWSYDPIDNAVVFALAQAPAPGATVTVTYEFGCP